MNKNFYDAALILMAIAIIAMLLTSCANKSIVGGIKQFEGSAMNVRANDDGEPVSLGTLWLKTLADASIITSIDPPILQGYVDKVGQCKSNVVMCNGAESAACYNVNDMTIQLPCKTEIKTVEHMYKHYIEHAINLDPDPTHISSMFTDSIQIINDVE